MTVFCGWINSHQVASSHETLMGMLAKERDAGFKWLHEALDSSLAVQQHSRRCGIAVQGGLHAVILGRPVWPGRGYIEDADEAAGMLLDTYIRHGQESPKHIGGSFALVVLDTDNRRCLLAIDRMGIESLAYSKGQGDGELVFASSIGAVRRHPAVGGEINYQSLYNYIYFHVIPSPDSIFARVSKLEPAQQLWLENGKIQLKHYWMPQFLEQGDAASLEDELRECLDKAVVNCRPDDTTGAFLSGGLDSSTVAGYLARHQSPARAFSIGFEEEGYDEIPFARIAAKHFNAEIAEYYVTPEDVVGVLPLIASAYDEPFGNSSAIPVLFCARLAKQKGMNALLAGDGGDELFAGNTRYAKQQLFEIYDRLPALLKSGLLEPLFLSFPLSKLTPPTRKIRSYIEQARMPMPARVESYNFLNRTLLDSIFTPEFLQAVDTSYPVRQLTDTYDKVTDASMLNCMLYLDWKITLADNDLRKVNRMCEITGIDVRYPMLDDDVIALSTRVPSRVKLPSGKLRHFYKSALRDFLPPEVLTKSKHGFGLPFGQWLKKSGQLQESIYGNLSAFKSRRILNPEFLDKLIDTHRTGHASYYGSMIWVLAVLEEWLRQHEVDL